MLAVETRFPLKAENCAEERHCGGMHRLSIVIKCELRLLRARVTLSRVAARKEGKDQLVNWLLGGYRGFDFCSESLICFALSLSLRPRSASGGRGALASVYKNSIRKLQLRNATNAFIVALDCL
jgi:hypothetical protein